MNTEVILKALQQVEEVGHISPTSEPPDILGVLMNVVAADCTNLGSKLDMIRMRCEITPVDVTALLDVSEKYRGTEAPTARRNRLIDHFAKLLEIEQIEATPPEDFNVHEMED